MCFLAQLADLLSSLGCKGECEETNPFARTAFDHAFYLNHAIALKSIQMIFLMIASAAIYYSLVWIRRTFRYQLYEIPALMACVPPLVWTLLAFDASATNILLKLGL